MRILTIVDKLSAGGRQRVAQDYTLGYRKYGAMVAVLALQASGPRLEVLRQAGVPVFVGGDPEQMARAVEEAGAWGADVLHLHSEGPVRDFEAEAIRALLRGRSRRPAVLETASFGRVDYRQRFQETDVHLLVAPWVLWRWQQWARPLRPPPLGAVVPNIVDATRFFPAAPSDVAAFRRAHGIPTNAFVFGCVARPDPLKWPGFMFEAFEEVARAHPSAFFVGAGFDDTARARIAAFPEDVRRRVVELPFLHDDEVLRTCYSAMDVFLHGSPIGETFGLVFGEALLCGTPIVTHSTPARHNSQLGVVGHERGGLVAASERYVAVAMARLLTTPALVEQLARRGSEYVRQHYTEEHVIPLLLRVIGHAQQASSRAALGAALGADPGIVTHVPDEHVRSLLANTLGRTPLRARILMRLVHKPALFRAWWAIKGRLRRQPDTDPAMPPSASVSASVSDHA